jgi:mannose/fructose-specific phosphotransferase system component IIA
VVRAWVEALGPEDDGVVLIDDYGGSCASAARLGGAEARGIPVISGVNLTMLLALVTWREELELAELAQRVVDQGRQAVKLVGGAR